MVDDIEPVGWLSEIGLAEYADTFQINFCLLGGTLLSRERLRELRLTDYPKLSIENFEHAKVLHNHVQHTLLFPYDCDERRAEMRERLAVGEDGGDGSKQSTPMSPGLSPHPLGPAPVEVPLKDPQPPSSSKPSATRPVANAELVESPCAADDETSRAATMIQIKMKGKLVENRIEEKTEQNKAANFIQNKIKSSAKGKEVAQRVGEKQRAASMIQSMVKGVTGRHTDEESKDAVAEVTEDGDGDGAAAEEEEEARPAEAVVA